MEPDPMPSVPANIVQAMEVLVDRVAVGRGIADARIALKSAIAELAAERDRAIAECKLMEHKVITCGVAAHHPDANLTRTGAYAEKWDSPQAEDVRKLRAERDAAVREKNVTHEFLSAVTAQRDELLRAAKHADAFVWGDEGMPFLDASSVPWAHEFHQRRDALRTAIAAAERAQPEQPQDGAP